MNFKSNILPIALAVFSVSVMAGGFDGPFIQGGLGLSTTKPKSGSFLNPGLNDGESSTRFIGSIAAGYSRSANQFTWAGSLYYVMGDQKTGSFNRHPNTNLGFKGSGVRGFTIEPGYNLSHNTLIYGKFGLAQMRGRAEGSVFPGQGIRRTHVGYGYGAGLRIRLNDNLYGMAEIMQTDFNRKDYTTGVSVRPSTFTGMMGIGYSF